jgi:16S rRNA processing protein RimM
MAGYLAVARLRKPHGLKGEVVVHPLTDDPGEVLSVGRTVTPIDEEGRPVGQSLIISRSRPYQRSRLLQFEGVDSRSHVEAWKEMLLGMLEGELEPPGDGEMYVHEIPGAEVVVDGSVVGTARELIEVPGGNLLAVDMDGREVLVPFREPILKRVDRERRRIVLDPPPGLLEF